MWHSKYDKSSPGRPAAAAIDPTAAARQYQMLEPRLHKAFFTRVQSGKPFIIKSGFRVFTQMLVKSKSGGSIQEGVRQVSAGDEMTCVSYDAILKNFIFKNQRDEEFEIYFTPKLALTATSDMRNDAYFGLLLNTDLLDEVISSEGSGE